MTDVDNFYLMLQKRAREASLPPKRRPLHSPVKRPGTAVAGNSKPPRVPPLRRPATAPARLPPSFIVARSNPGGNMLPKPPSPSRHPVLSGRSCGLDSSMSTRNGGAFSPPGLSFVHSGCTVGPRSPGGHCRPFTPMEVQRMKSEVEDILR